MELRQLNYFYEVAKRKSFSGAARALHVSQPSISKMIKIMEDEFGVTLFNRSSRLVELTDAGHVILGHVQKILQATQDLNAELADVTSLKMGQVRIGLPPMVGEVFFPKIIGLFHQHYPQIKMQLLEVGAKKVEEGVEDGSLDLGVSLLPVAEDTFSYFELIKDPVRLVLHPDHPLCSRSSVPFSELRHEPFILYRQDFALHSMISNGCTRAGFEPDVICETSQWDFMAKTVSSGLGIALLPDRVCQELTPFNVKFVPLTEPEVFWHLAIIWRKSSYMSYAARQWLDFAKSQFSTAASE